MSTLVNKIKLQGTRIPYYKIRKKLRSKHRHAYTMLILSLFTMSFFGFFALRPTLVTIASLDRQIKDSREMDERLTAKLNMLVQAQAEYEVVAPFLPKIRQAIPEHPEYTDLLVDIENIREATGGAVSKFGVSSVELKAETPGKVDLSVDAEGGYFSLEDLVNLLLGNERLLTVNSLDFIAGEQDVLGLTLDVSAPYTQIKKQEQIEADNMSMEKDIIK